VDRRIQHGGVMGKDQKEVEEGGREEECVGIRREGTVD